MFPVALPKRVSSVKLTRWQAYAFTVAITAIALWLRLVLPVEFGSAPIYLIFAVPILIAAIAGDLGTGLLATLLSALGEFETAKRVVR